MVRFAILVLSALLTPSLFASDTLLVNGHIYIGSGDNLFPQNQQGRLYVYDLPTTR